MWMSELGECPDSRKTIYDTSTVVAFKGSYIDVAVNLCEMSLSFDQNDRCLKF